jgi:hypothetical protein
MTKIYVISKKREIFKNLTQLDLKMIFLKITPALEKIISTKTISPPYILKNLRIINWIYLVKFPRSSQAVLKEETLLNLKNITASSSM